MYDAMNCGWSTLSSGRITAKDAAKTTSTNGPPSPIKVLRGWKGGVSKAHTVQPVREHGISTGDHALALAVVELVFNVVAS